ncbi:MULTISPECIES: urea amidolyase family protein [Microbacterium]|uniref:5-oxoprolinase subunit B/C family protein n=1 Tax=Microbacterium TaxID=33882 RepID=UPI0027855E10|nr:MULTISPECIES: urea amidolyase family protein [Microbacterium]MDQ1074415.1 KipI family sensor histidine kinase inhibitor [Microbacterium sp. SORGH_AS_0969]MDQ1114645.1 KipI family sensor histidine kinase inhibitor [Microbacterium testaceum]
MVTLRPMGERAVLAEVADLAAVLALHAALAADPPAGIDDLVPAARTVLVAFDPRRISLDAVRAWIHAASRTAPDATPSGPLVEVPLRYDGADLTSTAASLGIRVDELITRHSAAPWTVAFTGFAPGFAYLVSEDWPFDVPRLAQPRTRVPAGAVGLAGGFSGAYPRETPGGWRLIGTTDAVLFDPDAADPVLLPPRARVRFVPQPARIEAARVSEAEPRADGGSPEPPEPVEGPRPLAGAESGGDLRSGGPDGADSSSRAGISSRPATALAPAPALHVLDSGGFTTVQDLGRPHLAALGVARSGALDRTALRIANRLVGNAEGAAGLEIALGGFRARAEADTWVCVTGALTDLRVDGRARDLYAPVRVPAGAEISIGPVLAGLRSFLALRGGVLAPLALGSRASDVLAGLGPAPVRAGDVMGAETPASAIPVLDFFPWSVPPTLVEVNIAAGPRADWFAPGAQETLVDTEWEVSTHADRVGIRLDGPELERLRPGELPSEGMRPGAIQVPPHGRPVVLLADGPVTGGYPVIAVVTDATLDALAQVRPGDRVRFRRV